MSSIWNDVNFDYQLAQQAVNTCVATAAVIGDSCTWKAAGAETALEAWTGAYADDFAGQFTKFLSAAEDLQRRLIAYANSIASGAMQASATERRSLDARLSSLQQQAQEAKQRQQSATDDREGGQAAHQFAQAQSAIAKTQTGLATSGPSITFPAAPAPVPTKGAWTDPRFQGNPGTITSARPGDLFQFCGIDAAGDIGKAIVPMAGIEVRLRMTHMDFLPPVPFFELDLVALTLMVANLDTSVGNVAGAILRADGYDDTDPTSNAQIRELQRDDREIITLADASVAAELLAQEKEAAAAAEQAAIEAQQANEQDGTAAGKQFRQDVQSGDKAAALNDLQYAISQQDRPGFLVGFFQGDGGCGASETLTAINLLQGDDSDIKRFDDLLANATRSQGWDHHWDTYLADQLDTSPGFFDDGDGFHYSDLQALFESGNYDPHFLSVIGDRLLGPHKQEDETNNWGMRSDDYASTVSAWLARVHDAGADELLIQKSSTLGSSPLSYILSTQSYLYGAAGYFDVTLEAEGQLESELSFLANKSPQDAATVLQTLGSTNNLLYTNQDGEVVSGLGDLRGTVTSIIAAHPGELAEATYVASNEGDPPKWPAQLLQAVQLDQSGDLDQSATTKLVNSFNNWAAQSIASSNDPTALSKTMATIGDAYGSLFQAVGQAPQNQLAEQQASLTALTTMFGFIPIPGGPLVAGTVSAIVGKMAQPSQTPGDINRMVFAAMESWQNQVAAASVLQAFKSDPTAILPPDLAGLPSTDTRVQAALAQLASATNAGALPSNYPPGASILVGDVAEMRAQMYHLAQSNG